MIKIVLLLFLLQSAMAAPQSLEVWFISAHKKAEVQQLINERPYVLKALTAELKCEVMGDFCFDPQFGLYKKDDMSFDVDTTKAVNEKTPSIPAATSIDRNMIDCDPKNYFDIFCGKARKEAQANFKMDLWIDTSSSMREMDFSDKDGSCFRKSMMKRLDESCPFNKNVNVMMYDTSIKQAGSMDALCINQGLNDSKRLIDWIERSDAKKLVVITDIHEFTVEFADYIESKNGKIRGDKEPLVAAKLLDMVDDLAKSCR
ncbi:MAG: hypothetical protein H0V66_03210 [Bdellovibrionales bacterium]|nr:hypothetical protein [Bdellovibrionales bacterium]